MKKSNIRIIYIYIKEWTIFFLRIMESRHQMKAEKTRNSDNSWSCRDMFEPFQSFRKNSHHFCFWTSKFLLFHTFIEEKRDKFFLRFTAIIIFPQRLDTLFCFFSATQRKKETLDSGRNRKDAYTTKGFSSWKKAPQCFEEHQQTHCHKNAASYHIAIPKCKDVGDMTNHNLVNVREKERKY